MRFLIPILLTIIVSSPVCGETILTFDDGSKSVIMFAFPLLRQYGMHGTIYINPGRMDSGGDWYLTWKDIRVLSQHGWDVEAHGFNHEHLPALTKSQLADELDKCNEALIQHGYTPNHFALPFGETSPSVQKEIKKRFKTSRLAWAEDKLSNNRKTLDRYNLIANNVDETTPFSEITRVLSEGRRRDKLVILVFHQIVPMKSNVPKYAITYAKFKLIVQHIQGPTTTMQEFFK